MDKNLAGNPLMGSTSNQVAVNYSANK